MLVKTLLTFGLGPAHGRLLSVKGRKSGLVHTTPVNLVHQDGSDYLVSPYANVSWTRNARAAHTVSLRRGGRDQDFKIEELAAREAGPILRQYVSENGITRPFFDVTRDSSDGDFIAEAPKHPAFRLQLRVEETGDLATVALKESVSKLVERLPRNPG
jgi:hypothetical protein